MIMESSIKTRVMDFVSGCGEAKRMDIIRFIIEDIHNQKWDKVKHRGHYSSAFSSNDSSYFIKPSKKEPRFLRKNQFTKKWYVVKGEESQKILENQKHRKKHLELLKEFNNYLMSDQLNNFFNLTTFKKIWDTLFNAHGSFHIEYENNKTTLNNDPDRQPCSVKIIDNESGSIISNHPYIGSGYIKNNKDIILVYNPTMLFHRICMFYLGNENYKNL